VLHWADVPARDGVVGALSHCIQTRAGGLQSQIPCTSPLDAHCNAPPPHSPVVRVASGLPSGGCWLRGRGAQDDGGKDLVKNNHALVIHLSTAKQDFAFIPVAPKHRAKPTNTPLTAFVLAARCSFFNSQRQG